MNEQKQDLGNILDEVFETRKEAMETKEYKKYQEAMDKFNKTFKDIEL